MINYESDGGHGGHAGYGHGGHGGCGHSSLEYDGSKRGAGKALARACACKNK